MDVMELLAVWGVVAMVWVAIGIFDGRRKTERFFRQLDVERERGQDGTTYPNVRTERRIA
jgi:hypothetical protein